MRFLPGRLGSVFVVLLVGLLSLSGEARAERSRAVALFPMLERDAADRAVIKRMTARLVEIGDRLSSIELVGPRRLSKRLRSSPQKAIVHCGSDLACIAGLGRRVNADEVVLTRASGEGAGVTFVFLVVDVARKEIVRNARATAGSKMEVETALAEVGRDVFGVSASALTAAASPAVSSTTSPADIRAELAEAERAVAVAQANDTEPGDTESAEVGTSSVMWTPERDTLKYATIATSGLAVALLATGAGFGISSASAWNKASSPTTVSQLEAQRLTDQSNSRASRANLMLGLASGALAVAAALFGWDWYLHGPMWSEPEP